MSQHVTGIAITGDTPVIELAMPCEVSGVDRSDLGAKAWQTFRSVVLPLRAAAAADSGG